MRLLNFLSTIAPVLVCLAAPDDAAGGGGSSSSTPTPPEPEGDTIEKKFDSAKGIILDYFKQLGGAMKERDDAQAETRKLQGQFDAMKKTAEDAQAESKRLKGELDSMTAARDEEKKRADTNATFVKNLESHCGVLGIDAKEAIKAPKQSAETAGDKKPHTTEYMSLKAKEDKGEIPHGTASKYLSRHKKEINAEKDKQ